MAQAGQHVGFWRSVRGLPARTPLRVKLTAAVLSLVAVALAVISVAGIGFLRNSLLNQQDQLLAGTASQPSLRDPSLRFLVNVVAGERSQPLMAATPGVSVDWVSGGRLYHVALPVAAHYGSNPQTVAGPQYTANASWLQSGGQVTVSAESGNSRWRVEGFYFPVPTLNGGQVNGTLVVGIDVTSVYQTIDKLTGIDVAISAVLLIGLFVIGVGLVRSSLRPLTEIEQTAGAIAAGDLSKRVPERDPRTEVGRLGRSLNAMLSQIEAAFHAQAASEEAARRSESKMRQFAADASHELRTPLTAIRGFAEYYRQRGGITTEGNGASQLTAADLDRIMRRVEQEAARMGILVEDMLLLARLDQQRPLDRRPVDLLTLAADAVHDARVIAPERSINLTVGSSAAMLVLGDEVRLRQVIGNLMSNALAHTPEGTPIDVLIRSGTLDEAPDVETGEPGEPRTAGKPGAGDQPRAAGHAAAVLEVIDHGPGLTPEQAERAFERFYRADQARTSGGTGLGLAIVAALVSAHGGSVWVRSEAGSGATFCIALPLTPEAAQAADVEDEEAETETEAETDTAPEPEPFHDAADRSGS